MARLPRPLIPGVPAHVIVRGNDRQAIFKTDGDRIFFHRCLCESSRQGSVAVHAYVFMTNHVHLLVTEGVVGGLAGVIQSLGRRYVSYFNFLHGRTGTLWEGRYRSSLVETERYLIACQRYIEFNPVRAGIVRRPSDYSWSSHRHFVAGVPDDLVTPHSMILSLATDELGRREEYARLFEAEPPAEQTERIRHAINKGLAIGSDEFARSVNAVLGRPTTVRRRGRPAREGADADRFENTRISQIRL
jgi:putative transposase